MQQNSQNMQKCGFCAMLTGLLRRAVCIGSRRGSTESYYKELGDQDTLKIEDKTSALSSESHDGGCGNNSHERFSCVWPELEGLDYQRRCSGRFLTLHKRRKKKLITRTLCTDVALLDDLNKGLADCLLDQSVHWNFNAFTLDHLTGGRCLPVLCIHLFHWYGLIKHFKLDAARIWKLFSLIEEGYHSTNPYHNSVHAADVTQAMHCFLQQERILQFLQPLEIMASIIGAIAHDVDHPGVNQPFLIATSNHLASLYQNTSVLENHHWRLTISCLVESGLLEELKVEQAAVIKKIGSLILATDITRQQEFLSKFKTLLEEKTLDLKIDEHRHFILQIALKCADISNPCRPWHISRKWALKVCEEFFRQGDYERKLNLPVTALCDRHTTSIPKIQAGFFKFVATPLVSEFHRFLQSKLSREMIENLQYNEYKWQLLLAQEMAEETRTEISEADIMDDDLETYSLSNMSDSAERLLPDRRSSLQPKRYSNKEQGRRFSAPLNIFQDTRSRSKAGRQPSLAEARPDYSGSDSERSLHSQLSMNRKGSDDKEKVLSTEKLLPDTSIATITTPNQATRLSHVFRESGWRLFRQQTFPPLDISRVCSSNTFDPRLYAFKTDNDQNDPDKTDIDEESEQEALLCEGDRADRDSRAIAYCGRRRESAPVGSQYRDNLAAVQLELCSSVTKRRSSVPTEVLISGKLVKDKKLRELLKGRKVSANQERRGSAPVSSDRPRGGLNAYLARHSSVKSRRGPTPGPATADFLAPTAAMFHLWFRIADLEGPSSSAGQQRRSSS